MRREPGSKLGQEVYRRGRLKGFPGGDGGGGGARKLGETLQHCLIFCNSKSIKRPPAGATAEYAETGMTGSARYEKREFQIHCPPTGDGRMRTIIDCPVESSSLSSLCLKRHMRPRGFSNNCLFYSAGLLALRLTPNLEDQGTAFIWPLSRRPIRHG